ERRLCLAMLVGLGERERGFIGGAGFLGLFHLPPFPGAPCRNDENDQDGGGEDVVAPPLPQLLELLAADFLVDFAKDIGHLSLLRPGYGAKRSRVATVWQR